jgi:nuclear transport factor 2 (NTF2) superfamily protein
MDGGNVGTLMNDQELRAWLDAYGKAWESNDPDAAMQLFTEDARYYETPFDEPSHGREGVRSYWAGATGSQSDISFTYEIIATLPHRGIARWSAEFTRVTSGKRVKLDGVFVLDFDSDGLCRVLREWWHRLDDQRQDT